MVNNEATQVFLYLISNFYFWLRLRENVLIVRNRDIYKLKFISNSIIN